MEMRTGRVRMLRSGGGRSSSLDAVGPVSEGGLRFFTVWAGVCQRACFCRACCEREHTSLRYSTVITKQMTENAEAAAQGKKYGYCIQNGWAKTFGHRSCGLESCPPIVGLRTISVSMSIRRSMISSVQLYSPDCYSHRPRYWNPRKTLGDIRRVC